MPRFAAQPLCFIFVSHLPVSSHGRSDDKERYWVHWAKQVSPGSPPQHYRGALARKQVGIAVTTWAAAMPNASGQEIAILRKLGHSSAFGGLGCGLLLLMKAVSRSMGRGKIMVFVRSVAILVTV